MSGSRWLWYPGDFERYHAMVQNFYGDYGFKLTSEDADGNKIWELNVGDYFGKVSYIENEILSREVQ